ncbi:MAG: hypothetical protein AVDCRST_MAG52-1819, partial [uncultured Blastococcus sp.]
DRCHAAPQPPIGPVAGPAARAPRRRHELLGRGHRSPGGAGPDRRGVGVARVLRRRLARRDPADRRGDAAPVARRHRDRRRPRRGRAPGGPGGDPAPGHGVVLAAARPGRPGVLRHRHPDRGVRPARGHLAV